MKGGLRLWWNRASDSGVFRRRTDHHHTAGYRPHCCHTRVRRHYRYCEDHLFHLRGVVPDLAGLLAGSEVRLAAVAFLPNITPVGEQRMRPSLRQTFAIRIRFRRSYSSGCLGFNRKAAVKQAAAFSHFDVRTIGRFRRRPPVCESRDGGKSGPYHPRACRAEFRLKCIRFYKSLRDTPCGILGPPKPGLRERLQPLRLQRCREASSAFLPPSTPPLATKRFQEILVPLRYR